MHAQLKSKLDAVNLPKTSLKVFGQIKTNIHVTCDGRETAKKWGRLLGDIAKPVGGTVQIVFGAARGRRDYQNLIVATF